MSNFNRESVLSWFKGKSHAAMVAALDALDRGLAQGYWEKGWSRKVHAAATKANVAINIGRKAQKGGVFEPRPEYGTPGYAAVRDADYVAMSLRHGHVTADRLSKITMTTCDFLNYDQQKIVGAARAFHLDMAPVWAAIEKLDATRPKPVFTSIGLSPTVTATLKGLGIETGGAAFTVEAPEYVTNYVEVEVKGRKLMIPVVTIVWPEGCRHHTSRFPMMAGTNYNQCESCGHAIRNNHNWVPLLVKVEGQPPRSIWVGSDCAEKLFGFKIEGELEIANLPSK